MFMSQPETTKPTKEQEQETQKDSVAVSPKIHEAIKKVIKETTQTTVCAHPTLGYTLAPEKKTRRVQLVLSPSVYQAALSKTQDECVSFNDYVQSLIIRDLQ